MNTGLFTRFLLIMVLSLSWTSLSAFDASIDRTNLTLEQNIAGLYIAYFNRSPDVAGLKYWKNKGEDATDGGKSRSDMVSNFVEISLSSVLTKENYPNLSDEELKVAQERQDLITNKVEVGLNSGYITSSGIKGNLGATVINVEDSYLLVQTAGNRYIGDSSTKQLPSIRR